ncbi:MAG: neutral/alkaline non-lysosomal ceramidase N-terminal domain-containing protein [Spirochaetia bacterium]
MKAGWSNTVITPPIGAPMAGFASRKGVSRGVHDHLYARALLCDGGEGLAGIVTADVVGFPEWIVEKIRIKAHENIGIDPSGLIIAATHNHSGPALTEGYGGFGTVKSEYAETLIDHITGILISAHHTMKPVTAGTGKSVISGVGTNRRTADGLPVDPELGAIRFFPEDNSGSLVLINYTCHAVVLGPDNLLFSADYPGYAVKTAENILGAGTQTMFTNGAAGDVNTGHSADLSALGYPIPGRTFQRASRLGRIVGSGAAGLAESLESEDDGTVRFTNRKVKLPGKNLPSLNTAQEELEAAKRQIKDHENSGKSEEELIKPRVRELYARLLVKNIRKSGSKREKEIEIEVQAVRIGSSVYIAIPLELFVSIGLRIKSTSLPGSIFIVGYANGSSGYMPSREAYGEGGYEPVSSKFSPDAVEILEREMISAASALF